MNDNDPTYYQEDNHGYWLLSPDYEFHNRMIRLCMVACVQGLACWLADNPNHSAIPF